MTKKKMIMYVVAVLLPLMLLLTGLKADVVCAAEKQYTITYKNVSNADNSGNPTKYTKTSKTITLKKPVRKGYDFVGWYSNSSLTKKVTKITKGSTGNKTLYAKWTAHKYNISFDGNGADGGKTLTQKNCRYGKKYVLSACGFTRKGYHFVGWNTKADGSGTAYEAGSYVKNLTAVSGKTIKLYAQWEIGSRATTVQIQKIFVDNNDKLCYAYIVGKNLFIVKTEEGMPKERLKLPMQHSSFGNIICDDSGYYYMVTGEPNKTENRDVDTMFITKYSPEGKVIKTVSSKGTDGNTKIPFYAGDCDIALNGNQLVVFYSRTMYKSGDGLNHQSDNVWSVDTESLEDFGEYGIYHSHSFAQRVVPFGNGFILSALGDGFPRAFSLDYIGYDHPSKELFHFWVEENTYSDWLANHYDDYYMRILNNTFSTHGDLVVLDDTRAALVAAAAPSMDYSAQYEKYGLFIQVFDVLGNLDSQEGYITSGERQGMSGCDGNEFFTDYGVKWLSLSEKAQISSVCAVNDNEGHLAILYMKKSDSVTGIYYLVTDYSGNVIKPETLLTTSFQNVTPIRPCILDGVVYFIGYDQDEYYNILSLDLAKALSDDGELPIATEKVAEEKDLLSVYEGTEITLKFDEVKVKSWTSSDEQVATISKKGVISAEKNGTAEITGRLSDGSTYTCTVKVWPLDAESEKVQKIESDRVSKVTIPDGVKKIATGMFRDCKHLSSVKLPAGLTEIGEEAFRGCTALNSITIPENVTVIGRGAFRDCVKLETVSLPNGVKTLSAYTFADCTSLVSVWLPDKLYEIKQAAFVNCTKLKNISFPDSLRYIRYMAFKECTALKTLDTKKVIRVNDYAFYNCSGLTTVRLSGASYVGTRAFEGCSNISELTFSESIYEIEEYAFKNCRKIQEVIIKKEDVDYIDLEIGQYAFEGCLGLKTVMLPNNAILNEGVFKACSSLETVQIPAMMYEISPYLFYDCTSLTTIIWPTISDRWTEEELQYYDESLIKITYDIGKYAFYGCKSLKDVGMLLGMVEDYAFYGCSSLTRVNMDVVYGRKKDIGDYSFAECSSLTEVKFSSWPGAIGNYAFYNATSLMHLVSETEENGSGYAYQYMLYPANYIGEHAFTGTGISHTENGYGVTKINENNRSFVSIDSTAIVIPNTVTKIAPYAFYWCEGLTDVTISNSVTSIGDYAFCETIFCNYDKPTTLVLPDSITYIGDHAFERAVGSIHFYIPESVSYIGEDAFKNCDYAKIYVKQGSYAEQWFLNDWYKDCIPGHEQYIQNYVDIMMEYY